MSFARPERFDSEPVPVAKRAVANLGRAVDVLTAAVEERQKLVDLLVKRMSTVVECSECGYAVKAADAPESGACPNGCDAWLTRAGARDDDDREEDEMDDAESRARGVSPHGGGDSDSNPSRYNLHVGPEGDRSATPWPTGPSRRPSTPMASGRLDGEKLPARRGKKGPRLL